MIPITELGRTVSYLPSDISDSNGNINSKVFAAICSQHNLDARASEALRPILLASIQRGQLMDITSAKECEFKPCHSESVGVEKGWTRHGNIWLLYKTRKSGGTRINVAVISKVSGGSARVALLEAQDYLLGAPGCMTKAEMYQRIREELFEMQKRMPLAVR
jgi:hypothetical protein